MLTRSASRQDGGVFTAARGLSVALSEQPGLEVAVFAGEDAETAADAQLWGHVPVKTRPVMPLGIFGFTPGLAGEVRVFAPSVVHLHGLWTHRSLVARSARRSGVPLVISPHGMLTSWALGTSALRKRVALRVYEHDNLRKASCVHALTATEAQEVRALGVGATICVIPNGVSVPADSGGHTTTRRSRESRELLYVGRLHPIKGLEPLLHGWSIFQNTGQSGREKWQLTIVGWDDGGYRRTLVDLVGRLGIGSSVTFAGPKFGQELSAAHARADAFILTSHSEAMPLTVLEAWSAGLPVIMTAECGLPVGFRQGAALETARNPEDIARNIAAMARMSDVNRKAMGRVGRAIVEEHFSWRRAAQSFEAVYRWLLGQGSRPDCVND